MINRLKTLLVMSMFSASACLNSFAEQQVQPATSPLGQSYHTFEPPREPVAAEPDSVQPDAPAGVISLRDALALTLMNSPQLRAFSWERRASEARELQASLFPNPRLELEMEEVGGSGERSGFSGAETSLQLSQVIELGHKRRKRMKVAALEKELVGLDYEARRIEVLTEATKAFVEVLAAQERLELSNELVQLSEQSLATVALRVEAGKDSPVEKTKAEVMLSTVRIVSARAGQDLDSARRQLAALWGSTTVVFEKVAGQLDVVSPVPQWERLVGLTGQNPDISRWSVEMKHRLAALNLERSKKTSDIKIGGGVQRFNETDENAFVFGISIPLQISDRNQAGVLEARYRLAQAAEQRRAAETKIHSQLSRAYQQLSNAYMQATELRTNVLQGAKNVFEATQSGYRQGKLDYLEVLDAQRTLFEARGRYIDALTSYHTAKADVERLIGQGVDEVEK